MAINIHDYPIVIRENLKANEEHTKFLYYFRVHGKNKRAIIDLTQKDWNKKDRIKYAERKMLEEKERASNSLDSDATVNDVATMYINSLPDGNYKKNRESYYDRNVKPTIGNKRACDVLPMHIQKLVDSLIKKGSAPATAKQAIEILSPAFRIARANRIMLHNPCDDVHIKIPKQKKLVSNASERLKALYGAIMDIYSNDPFYRAFFLLAVQGRRKSEIINLQVSDIILEQDYYILRDTKNGEDQKHYLPPNVKSAIIEFMPKSGLLFASRVTGREITTVHKQVLKIRKVVGDWFTLHYSRNLIVSAMSERGIDSIHLSGALGHNDPNTVLKYLSLNYSIGSKIASDIMSE